MHRANTANISNRYVLFFFIARFRRIFVYNFFHHHNSCLLASYLLLATSRIYRRAPRSKHDTGIDTFENKLTTTVCIHTNANYYSTFSSHLSKYLTTHHKTHALLYITILTFTHTQFTHSHYTVGQRYIELIPTPIGLLFYSD